MPDFFLEEPSEIEPERPARPGPVHLGSGGLHPTADVPASHRKGKDAPPVYLPCAHCARPVVHGETQDGTAVVLDAKATTYTMLWDPGAARPVVMLSRAYAVHVCEPLATESLEDDVP